jgi:hypothetical protein
MEELRTYVQEKLLQGTCMSNAAVVNSLQQRAAAEMQAGSSGADAIAALCPQYLFDSQMKHKSSSYPQRVDAALTAARACAWYEDWLEGLKPAVQAPPKSPGSDNELRTYVQEKLVQGTGMPSAAVVNSLQQKAAAEMQADSSGAAAIAALHPKDLSASQMKKSSHFQRVDAALTAARACAWYEDWLEGLKEAAAAKGRKAAQRKHENEQRKAATKAAAEATVLLKWAATVATEQRRPNPQPTGKAEDLAPVWSADLQAKLGAGGSSSSGTAAAAAGLFAALAADCAAPRAPPYAGLSPAPGQCAAVQWGLEEGGADTWPCAILASRHCAGGGHLLLVCYPAEGAGGQQTYEVVAAPSAGVPFAWFTHLDKTLTSPPPPPPLALPPHPPPPPPGVSVLCDECAQRPVVLPDDAASVKQEHRPLVKVEKAEDCHQAASAHLMRGGAVKQEGGSEQQLQQEEGAASARPGQGDVKQEGGSEQQPKQEHRPPVKVEKAEGCHLEASAHLMRAPQRLLCSACSGSACKVEEAGEEEPPAAGGVQHEGAAPQLGGATAASRVEEQPPPPLGLPAAQAGAGGAQAGTGGSPVASPPYKASKAGGGARAPTRRGGVERSPRSGHSAGSAL